MRTFYLLAWLLLCKCSFSQGIKEKLGHAISKLEDDEQFRHSIISMYVVDGKTGNLIYGKNGEVGMVPASCQKIIASASAFEILGGKFQYETVLTIYRSVDTVCLVIEGSGDPTLGSWRWPSTGKKMVFSNILSALKKKNAAAAYNVLIHTNGFTHQPVPDGWVWQDIGNYYGAGAWAFNWYENQYNLVLSSGNTEGAPVTVVSIEPSEGISALSNFIKTGKKGSGDNAYIYTAPYSSSSFATGTIPPGQKRFVISGSVPDPAITFIKELSSALAENGIAIKPVADTASFWSAGKRPGSVETIGSIVSPCFDSINYWFLKKSINLYGEAIVKTIAFEKTAYGSTDTGIALIKAFWAKKGIEGPALNIIDGSGLSPANRITASALVQVLQYSKKQPWFSSFYNALPEMNGIKMKDGYIGGVRSYTGYIRSGAGTEYSFAFIVNNFYGNPVSVREKMWKVLDLLK